MRNAPLLVYNNQMITFNLSILLYPGFINVVSNQLMNCVNYTIFVKVILVKLLYYNKDQTAILNKFGKLTYIPRANAENQASI